MIVITVEVEVVEDMGLVVVAEGEGCEGDLHWITYLAQDRTQIYMQ